MIQGTHTLQDQVVTFKEELLKLSEIKNVTISDFLPVKGTKRNGNPFWVAGRREIDQSVGGQIWQIDPDYIPTLGMKLVAGRNFDPNMASDSAAVIINQKMAQKLGLTDPVGKDIQNWQIYHVIGVVEDFHFESMKEDIGPICMVLGKSSSVVSAKISTTDMPALIQSVNEIWRKFSPNQAIRYTFLDDSYANMYADVQRTGYIFTSFAVLAIVVACLGLFALSAFMVEQRSKEISIRLVLGASVNHIFQLLTRNFLILVLISLVFAIPIAWYMMQKWLEDYIYKTNIGWEVFLIAGGLSLLIALVTISYQSVRAALANPVDSLKSE
jgi:putative ABC transport system permease protein